MIEATFDPKAAPSPDAVKRLLGRRAGLWQDLVHKIEAMGARGGWVWGGPKYGWEWKAKRAGKPFATLTPKAGVFVVLVILGRTDAAAAAAIPLAPRLRETYEAARQFPDGAGCSTRSNPRRRSRTWSRCCGSSYPQRSGRGWKARPGRVLAGGPA